MPVTAPEKTLDVVGVGNALVDIQCQVPESFLGEIGFEKGIMTLVDDDKQSAVLSRMPVDQIHRCSGGSAANTIVGLVQLGGTGGYIGRVGKDDIGEFFRQDMLQHGVQVHCDDADAPSGTCAILITPDAQRTMLTNLGAAGLVSDADLDASMIAASRYLYIEGYLLTADVGHDGAYRAMELAKQSGTKVALTASDPFLVNLIRDEFWELLRGPVDLFFCNEEEAKSLTGEDDVTRAAAKIHESVEDVALTLGDKGSLLMRGGDAIPISGVPVAAVDTTGAGDMFAGAYLYGLTAGMDAKTAGDLASKKAAEIVAQMGPRLSAV